MRTIHPRWLVPVTLAVAVSACNTVKSFMPERRADYRTAETLPPLRIPPELARGSTRGAEPVAVPTERRVAYPESGAVERTPRGGGRRENALRQWLVVSGEPVQRLTDVREFFETSGLPVLVADAETGILETGWIGSDTELNTDLRSLFAARGLGGGASRDKFEARVTAGEEPGTTAIQITHRGLTQVEHASAAATTWERRDSDNELEAEVMGLLATSMGAEPVLARRADTTAAPVIPAERVTLRRSSDGVPALTVRDPYDQVWKRVGESLGQLGVTVEGEDPDGGIYYVRYPDPDRAPKKKGFWRRIIPPRGDDEEESGEYQVKLTPAGTVSLVTIRDADGLPDRSETGERILSMLHEQLR